jgi:hypothetical protein
MTGNVILRGDPSLTFGVTIGLDLEVNVIPNAVRDLPSESSDAVIGND